MTFSCDSCRRLHHACPGCRTKIAAWVAEGDQLFQHVIDKMRGMGDDELCELGEKITTMDGFGSDSEFGLALEIASVGLHAEMTRRLEAGDA